MKDMNEVCDPVPSQNPDRTEAASIRVENPSKDLKPDERDVLVSERDTLELPGEETQSQTKDDDAASSPTCCGDQGCSYRGPK